jgi:hypothetical protein
VARTLAYLCPNGQRYKIYIEKILKTDSKPREQRTILSAKLFFKNQVGVKTAVGSELSLVSGTYHENKVSVVMEMASFCLKIRQIFGFTSLTERSIGAGPPVIIQLSGYTVFVFPIIVNFYIFSTKS